MKTFLIKCCLNHITGIAAFSCEQRQSIIINLNLHGILHEKKKKYISLLVLFLCCYCLYIRNYQVNKYNWKEVLITWMEFLKEKKMDFFFVFKSITTGIFYFRLVFKIRPTNNHLLPLFHIKIQSFLCYTQSSSKLIDSLLLFNLFYIFFFSVEILRSVDVLALLFLFLFGHVLFYDIWVSYENNRPEVTCLWIETEIQFILYNDIALKKIWLLLLKIHENAI